MVFPTYEPHPPDRNPMFLENRVYQGSSGRVYPLPFYNRVAEQPTEREWDSVTLSNEYIEVLLLPEIGGRVHAARDLTNGFDFIYRQGSIKPALVGLGGPWISGGIEFNWPQHHRPSTFMPTDVEIEHGDDGSVTVWMSEHEPMSRTKGMHGICLYPGRSVIEIKVRLYNRTPYVQTFLWWANIGVRVHEAYKSFFPPDAHVVADHAKRALSEYPLCQGHYYGVDYGRRGREGVPVEERPSKFVPAHCGGQSPDYAPNDLSWYANIPVPTSYMCMGTKDDFFGGYDFKAGAGLIHVADHLISPGKKQWTWGNHDFGYAWDRNLSDDAGPYIELMAGVFTDNQPDFSFIGPGETRAFSQFLYPYREIGPLQYANVDAGISITAEAVGVIATRQIDARILVDGVEERVVLAPDRPFIKAVQGAHEVRVFEGEGEIAAYKAEHQEAAATVAQAVEPALPREIGSIDQLYLTGRHLDQYRHATRRPEDYWLEALRRDPGDLRCNNALGMWRLRRGEFDLAVRHFETAIARATALNPNPEDGEPFYNLGLALRFLGRDEEAVEAFGKAAWDRGWQAPAYHALGELACRRADWKGALDYLERSLRKDADNLRAMDLRAMVLRKLGRHGEAQVAVEEALKLDPLDWWARLLRDGAIDADNGVRLDLAIDLMRAGLYREAADLLKGADAEAKDGTAPMVAYYQAYLRQLHGEDPEVDYQRAAAASPDYCFPARLEDVAVLQSAPEGDARAAYYLGNLFYDRRRYDEAIECWERSVRVDPSNSIVHRNLGIAAFNVQRDFALAREHYKRAIEADPADSRLLYEQDQLWKRLQVSARERLAELDARRELVDERDDLTIEYCGLLHDEGRVAEAAEILEHRRFQPWEGGEGAALGIYTRTHLALGQEALASDPQKAKSHFEKALNPPQSLGEARHLLANASDVWLAMGDALHALGDGAGAERWWTRAAEFEGDFQEMSVRRFSDLTYFQAVALQRLGRTEDARRLLQELEEYARELESQPAKIDYFATSLPTMLLFNDDLQARRQNEAKFLQAQAARGLGP